MKTQSSKSPLTATKLRLVLSILLLLILVGMAVGFYFAYSFLNQTAKTAAETQAEAMSSDARLQNLRQLEAQLKKYEDTIQTAQSIVADSQSYQYQNQIINDITNYANQAGISIVSITFPDSSGSSESNSPAPAPQAAPTEPPAAAGEGNAEGGSESAPAAAAPAAPSIKSVQASIQLGEGVNYNSLLHFVHLIEQNLTRMQISDLSLSGGSGESGGSSQNLNIEVYVK